MNDMTRPGEIDPPYLFPDYRSTRLRAPREALLSLPPDSLDVPGPLVPPGFVRDRDNDLTAHGKSAPLGEKMVVAGRVLDESGRPVRRSLRAAGAPSSTDICDSHHVGQPRGPNGRSADISTTPPPSLARSRNRT